MKSPRRAGAGLCSTRPPPGVSVSGSNFFALNCYHLDKFLVLRPISLSDEGAEHDEVVADDTGGRKKVSASGNVAVLQLGAKRLLRISLWLSTLLDTDAKNKHTWAIKLLSYLHYDMNAYKWHGGNDCPIE